MKKHDLAWFDTLYLRNYKRLFNMARCTIYSLEQAEELVQDAFLTYLSTPYSEGKEKNPDAWLTTTMKNLIRNELKRASRPECSLGEFSDFRAAETEEPFESILPRGLSPKERQLLIWYYKEQLTHDEMAERLHISAVACRARLYRAKKHCQELFFKKF